MKILWFSNSPVSVATVKNLDYVGGGWIESLELEISRYPGIELGIVIQQEINEIQEQIIGNVRYFICPVRTGRIKRKIGLGRVFKVDDEQAVSDYLNVINRFNPDIIQIFGSENNYGLIIPEISIPVIIHIQGILTLYNNKYYSGISKFDVYRFTNPLDYLKGSDINITHKNWLKFVAREQKILASCSYVTGRTDWDKRAARYFAPEARYFHCEEMLRKEFFSYQWKLPDQKIYRILTVSRSNIYKGFDVIIRACNLLKQKNILFKWNIAGSSENEREIRLFQKKYKKNWPENVHFLGNKNAGEIIELMKISNVFVQTSYIDNSPNSVCEAMLAGMPVIANYAGGIASLLEDKSEGILLQEGDPISLAAAILELAANPEQSVVLGQNARTRALQRHNPDTIVKRILEIYRIMTKQNPSISTQFLSERLYKKNRL